MTHSISRPASGGAAWAARWRAVLFGLGAAGVLAAAPAATAGLTGPGPRAATAQAEIDCPPWACGSNRNQVLL